MRKICPTCKKKYTEIDNYCTNCGIQLEEKQMDIEKLDTAIRLLIEMLATWPQDSKPASEIAAALAELLCTRAEWF